jgi:hypothetical protein
MAASMMMLDTATAMVATAPSLVRESLEVSNSPARKSAWKISFKMVAASEPSLRAL